MVVYWKLDTTSKLNYYLMAYSFILCFSFTDSDLSDQEVLTQTGVDSAVSMQVESEVSTQVDTDSDVFQTTGGGVCKKSSSLSVITHVSANDLVK